MVVDVITENARRGVISELLYSDDLVLMSEAMEDLKERFWNWKDALENKGLKVNTTKTKVMVSGSEGELFKSKIDPCGVCEGKSWPIQCCAENVETENWKLAHLQMCKYKESYFWVGSAFCLLKM